MSVSIKDIAKAAGVSHPTVSRALADSSLVNVQTKERIQAIAREMGYSPDAQARSLVRGRTQTVGVVVTTITDPFVAQVVRGIEDRAQELDYTVILTNSNSEPEREMGAVEMLRSKRVDSVIVTSSRLGALYLDHLERIGVPVVLINDHNEQSGHYTFSIRVDNRHGGHMATEHLVEQGHRRIGYVTSLGHHSSNEERMAGYREALLDAGLPFEQGLVVEGTGRPDGGQGALDALRARGQLPTAVFCYNDMTAIGLLKAAREVGLAVPDDLAVVGFDDIPFAALVHPSLTTVAQPQLDMGRQAMDMALTLMTEGTTQDSVSDVVIKGELIVRESSC